MQLSFFNFCNILRHKLNLLIWNGSSKRCHLCLQVRKVQKCVETLDMLKIKNSMPTNNGNHNPKEGSPPAHQRQDYRYSNEQAPSPVQQHQDRHSFGNFPVQSKHQEQLRHSTSGSVVITTQWETFDSTPAPLLDHFSSPTTTSSTHAAAAQSRLSWDLL